MMNKVNCHIKNHKELYILLLISILLFGALYRYLLSGAYIYAYTDIGSDTVNTYLPRFLFDGRWLMDGRTSEYGFSFGLGTYVPNPIFKYLLPFNWVLIGCTSQNIGQCLVISLFLKVICTVIFAYAYFKEITGDAYAGMLGGLLWSFSSYMVIWGQHYQYATWICLFTIAMYLIELYIKDRKAGWLLIPVFAFMLLETYYELYMNGIFMAIYLICRMIFMREQQNKGRYIRCTIAKLAGLAVMAVVSAMMAAVKLWPDLLQFFASTRSSELGVEGAGLLYDKHYLITFAARFLSPNLLLPGKYYTGAYNYYEAALLAVSLFSLFAFFYMVQTGMRRRVWCIGILSGLALICPVVSKVLNMNAGKQRWSYMLCFAITICIVLFVNELRKETDGRLLKRRLLRCLVLADGMYLLMILLLYAAHRRTLITLDRQACLLVCGLIVAYNLLLVIWMTGKQRVGQIVLCLIMCAEVLLMNNASVNQRDLVSKAQWTQDLYEDGTKAVVQEIKAEDPGLYRMNKTYTHTLGYNDALAQDYCGVAVYSSLNTAPLVNFYQTWGYELLRDRSHYIMIPCSDFYINSFLSVRYCITEQGTQMEDIYEPVLRKDPYVVYRNPYAMPMAWIYHKELDQKEAVAVPIRGKAMAFGYFLTDHPSETLEDTMTAAEIQEGDGVAAMDTLLAEAMTHTTWDGHQLSGTIHNAQTDPGMLAFSVIYDRHWRVYIDGVQVETCNINGGLLGAKILSGTHEVKAEYVQPGEEVSAVLSLIVLAGYVIFMCIFIKKRKKPEK